MPISKSYSPLKRNEESEKKEVREGEINKNKDIKDKKVTKIIKEILPYTYVGFDGEEPKENNQDNYFILKIFAEKKIIYIIPFMMDMVSKGILFLNLLKKYYLMLENLKDRNILKETELS